MNTPNYGYGWQTGAGRIDRALFDEGLRQHMLRVYNYMGLGLVLTGLVAYVVGTTPALYVPIFSTPLKWVVMLAPLAFVLFFSFRMQTISAAGAQGMFWAFCAVMGLSMASIFLVFTGTSIARTFFIAAAMFRRHQPLRLYDQARSLSVRLFLDHGPDRRRDRQPSEHLPRIEHASVCSLHRRHPRLRRADRMGYPID
jgi:Inhibitor of apoptosis-promoting Bax1